jgi:hypothetical protein
MYLNAPRKLLDIFSIPVNSNGSLPVKPTQPVQSLISQI